MREERTEVLVVGAGPVGLWTALLLARAGIQVNIIDRQPRTTTRSYACALHPQTLKSVKRLGLAETLIQTGRRIATFAFYEGQTRQAEVTLSKLDSEFPFALVLPQNTLEETLEQALQQAGVRVQWNHRFDAVEEEVEMVAATVEELEGTASGYIVPHWEVVVKDRFPVRTQFLIGADGHNSLVRQRLGIACERVGATESFAAFEFESDAEGPEEARIVLDATTTNVLWPLPGKQCRWTFQLSEAEAPGEFPEKERRAVRLIQASVDERIREYVQKVTWQRAPWFTAKVREISWCTQVTFERQLARQFGQNRCWLLGDAAHQTGPVGVQSMNAGFGEAEALVKVLRNILREEAPLEQLEAFNREQHQEWRRLLGPAGGLKARSDTHPWVSQRAARILPCLPATNGGLAQLASQLKLDLV